MEDKFRLTRLGISVAQNNMKFLSKELDEINIIVQDNLEFLQELDQEIENLRLNSQT
jgi:hypothetical protein